MIATLERIKVCLGASRGESNKAELPLEPAANLIRGRNEKQKNKKTYFYSPFLSLTITAFISSHASFLSSGFSRSSDG